LSAKNGLVNWEVDYFYQHKTSCIEFIFIALLAK
jgi:hypothetical protein